MLLNVKARLVKKIVIFILMKIAVYCIDMVVGRVMHSVVAFKETTMSYLAC